ncbi:thiolase family protein [Natrinema sp. 1APR25-10V2]|uniref:thiolase family protein n=1 Tax=Natrinema sp. 1APR25-10V2 TaxID=2951081 RepID=UPI0028747664|nr:thiolase family protein [Natrinema sp. 1APR25-10V2]MDS0476908.1 thiolase family protein [Natrinema sp. 1APR25-10V2]
MTAFTKKDERSLLELLTVAADRALKDASTPSESIDSLHVGNAAAEAFNSRSGLGNALASQMGITNADTKRIENTSASGASAFLDAVDAIRAGRSDAALVIGGEKMSAADTATSTEIISRITHDAEYAQGVTLPSFAGLAADRYLREYEADREDLAQIAIKNHANAAQNPYAQFKNEVTVEDVLESPTVAAPLRLFDCCPTSDGAAAAVITAGGDGVQVAACESAVGTHAVADRSDPLMIESVRRAGKSAYTAAEVTPTDLDVACIHDAFSILEWLETEELGLAERGEAWRLTIDGTTASNGELPINPGGGLKARGHPLGATGVSQIVELVWQLRGDAPNNRAVDGADLGLAINVAGFGNNTVCTILRGGAS